MQVHQDLPATPARAEHRDAVVADGDHVRESTGRAAPARSRGPEDNQLRAGPAVEVRHVYPREDGVAVRAEGRGADLVWWGWELACELGDPDASTSLGGVFSFQHTGLLDGGVHLGDGRVGGC